MVKIWLSYSSFSISADEIGILETRTAFGSPGKQVFAQALDFGWNSRRLKCQQAEPLFCDRHLPHEPSPLRRPQRPRRKPRRRALGLHAKHKCLANSSSDLLKDTDRLKNTTRRIPFGSCRRTTQKGFADQIKKGCVCGHIERMLHKEHPCTDGGRLWLL